MASHGDSPNLCTRSKYNKSGNVTYTENSNGYWLKHRYDGYDRLFITTCSEGTLIRYTYTKAGMTKHHSKGTLI